MACGKEIPTKGIWILWSTIRTSDHNVGHFIDINFDLSLIIKLVCTLVVWLHIRAGMSRSVANTTLKALQLILTTVLYLIEVTLCSSGITVKLSGIKLPHNVHIANWLHFSKPKIIQTACYLSCFTLYSHPISWRYVWKASPRSRVCNTLLWKKKNTSKGHKWIPQCLYTIQSFDSWLTFFLFHHIIVDSLPKSFDRQTTHPLAAYSADMTNVQDSSAWRDLLGIFHSLFYLMFRIYINWFNPLTNKIAGMIMVKSEFLNRY